MAKKLFVLLLAFTMTISMMACGSSKAESGTPQVQEDGSRAPVTLRYYNYAMSEADKAAWWEQVIADFEAKYDWITVEPIVVDYNSMITTLTNDLASGLSADMIYGEVSWVPSLVDGGFIQKPADVLSPEFYQGYDSNTLERFEYLDGVYGVPHYMSNTIIFVNRELIEGAGLSMAEFPDTLEGLKVWIEQLAECYQDNANVSTIFGVPTAEVPASGACINSLYTAFGGTLIREDGSLADLRDPVNQTAMEETLDFCRYLIGSGYTQENQKLKDYRSAFGAGNVCMYIDQSWGYAMIDKTNENAEQFTVTAALPGSMGTHGKGNSLIEANAFLLGAELDEARKEAVDLFLQYVTSNEITGYYINNIGLAFPAHACMADCPISPILEGASRGTAQAAHQPMLPSIISVQTQLASSVLNYTVNGMSAEDTIQDYVRQAEYYINQ